MSKSRHKRERARTRKWLSFEEAVASMKVDLTDAPHATTVYDSDEHDSVREEMRAARGWKTSATGTRMNQARC